MLVDSMPLVNKFCKLFFDWYFRWLAGFFRCLLLTGVIGDLKINFQHLAFFLPLIASFNKNFKRAC